MRNARFRADHITRERPRPLLRSMEIGDHVTYDGRRYILRGLDPMGVDERRAEIEDAETGEHSWAPLDALVPAAANGA